MTNRYKSSNPYSDADIDEYDFVDEIYEEENCRDVNEDLYEETEEPEVEAEELPEVSEEDNGEIEIEEEKPLAAQVTENVIDLQAQEAEAETKAEPAGRPILSAVFHREDPVEKPIEEGEPAEALVSEETPASEDGEEPEANEVSSPVSGETPKEVSKEAPVELTPKAESPVTEEDPVLRLWFMGFSQFIISKQTGMSTKEVRDYIEEKGQSDNQGQIDLPATHAYWNASLPEKRNIERQMLDMKDTTPVVTKTKKGMTLKEIIAQTELDLDQMSALWTEDYSEFTIARHLGASTKEVRAQIETLGLTEKQGKLSLHANPDYQAGSLAEKREMERQLLVRKA